MHYEYCIEHLRLHRAFDLNSYLEHLFKTYIIYDFIEL